MNIRAIFWPTARKDYSARAAAGRLLYVAMIIIGSLGVVAETVFWDGRWDALFFFAAIWVGVAVFGRLCRYLLARE
ncbi:MAG: hypothetical protein KKC14_11625 [Alphaproteobacteria bacterium]|nr:hypothetical protein [Alphaproteobacteria bacterium]